MSKFVSKNHVRIIDIIVTKVYLYDTVNGHIIHMYSNYFLIQPVPQCQVKN